MQRLAVIAKLRPDAEARASELVEKGPPFDPKEIGFEHHSVYLAGDQVVFVFEGGRLDQLLNALVKDPARTGAFREWESVLDGVPSVAREVYSWHRDDWPEGWGE